MAKRLDRRRVKIHFNYDVTEVAALLGVHKLTVRRWIAAGLQTTDVRRPLLVRGADLSAFLRARQPVKQSCQPGEFFCLSCRAPKRPAGDMADYLPRTSSRGSLCGICPTCGNIMYRAVSFNAISQKSGGLDVAFRRAEQRLNDISSPLSNVDFRKDKKT
jgi:excisionase family DNA binding protein